MFEQETEQIIDLARQRTIGGGDMIALREILSADIPAPVKTFFRADIDLLLLDDLQQQRKGSRFDFGHPEVRSLERQMNSLLVLNFTFQRGEFLERLGDTVHLLANYLVRPQWTLRNVLFERRQEAIAAPALLRLLQYFGPYEYLKTLLVRYAREKQLPSLTQAEFRTLLWRMDAEYIRRKSGDELARMLFPFYDFFDYPRRSGPGKVLPARALIRYFEDKGLLSVLSALRESTAGEEIAQSELGELLENVRRRSGAFEAVQTVGAGAGEEEEGGGAGAAAVVRSGGGLSRPSFHGPEPGIQHHPPGAGRPDAGAPLAAARPAGQGLTPPEAETASGGKAAPAAPPLPGAARRLLEEIGEGDQRRFLRRIFRQDEAAFRSAFALLAQAPSWKEASRIIDEIFIENVLDPYSSDALRFTEMLFKQFHKTR